MASPVIKLYYYEFKGRAEMLRLLFAAAGQKYEDIRFSIPDWPKYKEKAPFAASPWVEVDDEQYAQSIAITVYFAREYGFYGKTNKDALKIDQLLNLIQDFYAVTIKYEEETDAEKKVQMMKDCKEKTAPRFLGYFENLIKKNGTGFVAGDQLSIADIALFDVVDGYLGNFLGPMDGFPLVNAVVDKVQSNEKIKAYLETRPVTQG